eukprot:sb/3472516/
MLYKDQDDKMMMLHDPSPPKINNKAPSTSRRAKLQVCQLRCQILCDFLFSLVLISVSSNNKQFVTGHTMGVPHTPIFPGNRKNNLNIVPQGSSKSGSDCYSKYHISYTKNNTRYIFQRRAALTMILVAVTFLVCHLGLFVYWGLFETEYFTACSMSLTKKRDKWR